MTWQKGNSTGLLGRLDHDDGDREAANDAVAAQEVLAERRVVERELADDGAARGDAFEKLLVLGRVEPREARAEHGHRAAARLRERALVRAAVDAARAARDDLMPRVASWPPSPAARRVP